MHQTRGDSKSEFPGLRWPLRRFQPVGGAGLHPLVGPGLRWRLGCTVRCDELAGQHLKAAKILIKSVSNFGVCLDGVAVDEVFPKLSDCPYGIQSRGNSGVSGQQPGSNRKLFNLIELRRVLIAYLQGLVEPLISRDLRPLPIGFVLVCRCREFVCGLIRRPTLTKQVGDLLAQSVVALGRPIGTPFGPSGV
ncbi:hypothetical protein MAP_2154c [Mycobacterium avium subsp. paratuberculosis K-10]|uniref:Uncharacterized protein n=1 Tax=Mycolicibacterium paratuberculosis (strain ATCC BAA-968 / K-10) TaxID=262316 RepID=Q73Y04_MYCPA|nr:hypothetical protein MAP_2154c [Mycobacterium avium subsp. paratuberculosis K-10]AGL36591.1 hypothetical protein MAP4_1668 [Mycobacterium avium subsp. paratuberculosis MAP4]